MDMPTVQAALIPTPSGTVGFETQGAGEECPYRDMTPQIPAVFGVRPDGAFSDVLAKQQQELVTRTLQVRRAVMDLVFNTRRNRGKLLIWESVVEEKLAKLNGSEQLLPYHRKRLEGELAEAKAMVEYCQEKIAHWQMEIRALRATGKGDI